MKKSTVHLSTNNTYDIFNQLIFIAEHNRSNEIAKFIELFLNQLKSLCFTDFNSIPFVESVENEGHLILKDLIVNSNNYSSFK